MEKPLDPLQVPKDSLSIANDLLSKFGCQSQITTVDQCDHNYFVNIYEAMLGEKLPGLTASPKLPEEEIHNVQVVIDSLATDVLGIDLSHISAQYIVKKDHMQIQNLLEIFDGLLDFVLEELDKDDERVEKDFKHLEKVPEEETTKDDSNLLPSDHDVLSDVFIEEFGHSYTNNLKPNVETKVVDQSCQYSPSKAFYQEKVITDGHNSIYSSHSWSKHGSDSTNDLIREAEMIEQRDVRKINIFDMEKKRNRSKMQKEKTGNFSSNSSGAWSSILTQTSSAVDSIGGIKEIGQRPRDKLAVEMKEETKKTRLHKHMHHHYHHHITDSPDSETNSITSSSSSLNRHLEVKQDKSCEKNTEHLTDTTNSFQSTAIQTQIPKLVDSSVQTDGKENESKISGKKIQSNIHEPSLPLHIEYLKGVKQSASRNAPTETRSKQLSDLSLRLQKLRNEFRAPQLESETNKQSSSPDESEPTRPDRKEKTKSRVSFANEDRLIEREFYSSDTEVDYSSPYRSNHTRKHDNKKNTMKLRSRLGNLRKTTLSDGSTSSSDELHLKNTDASITARFEEPFLKRDERLLDLRKAFALEQKENHIGVESLQRKYSKQRGVLLNLHDNTKKQKNVKIDEKSKKILRPPPDNKKSSKKKVKVSSDAKLINIYGKQRGRTDKIKARKRSASASPIGRRRRKTPMILGEDEILPVMEEEFPFIYLSPHTAKLMWQKQMRQVDTLSKIGRPHKSIKTQRRLEEAQRKQVALTQIMKKELEHNKRLKEYKEHKEGETEVKRKLAERRHRSARTRKYYDEFVIRNKAKMLKKRGKEEKIFKELFEDGLDIQKQRIREMREYAKEQKEKNARKQQNEIESMENYYRDQFSMLAGSIAQERYDVEVRQKAQKQVLGKMRSEIRKRMEKDVREIQEQLTNDDDSDYFRKLDADNLKREFQLATYKASRFRR